MRKSGFISILQYDERTLTRTRVKPGPAGLEVASFDQERGHWPAAGGELEKALVAFLKRLKVDEDAVVTVLSRHLVTVRIVTLPTHDAVEAKRMIQFSAEEYVPYPAEELVIQDAILRREPGGESRVLAVLAHQDVLKAHLAPLRKAGIIPERVLLSTVCLANAVAAATVPAQGPYAVVNLGSASLEVLVFRQGKLLFGRGVASEQDWAATGANAATIDEEIAIEVRGAISAFRRESDDGEGPENIFLASDYPVSLAERAECLANETAKECFPASFAKGLATSAGASASLIALGAALSATGTVPIDINLLPAQDSRARTVAGAKVLLKRAGYYAAGAAAALLLVFAQAYWQRLAYISELEEQLREVEPAARGLGEKEEQLAILRQQMKRGNSPIHMLAVAAEAAPGEKANVVQFRYDINEGVDIFGRAKAVDDVQAFASNLRGMAAEAQLALFKNARTMYEDRGNERGTPVIMYHINIPVALDEDGNEIPEAPAAEAAPETPAAEPAP